MKITQSKAKDLTAIISVEVNEIDYTENVAKKLQNYQKTVQTPGFRKGKTPMKIINKKYRTSVVIDEVNKLLQDQLYQYISEQKLKVLGSPIPMDEHAIDWNDSLDFNFKYEVGLAPDFDVNITSKDKLNYYKIQAETKLVDSYCNDIAKRYGKMSNPEFSVEGDLIFCAIEQLDLHGNVIDDGIKNDATVSMDYIVNSKIKKQFIGLKQDDSIIINVMEAFNNHSDLAAMLNIDNTALNNLTSEDFQFTVKNVNRLEPAELNADLFDKVYGPGSVNNEKEFKAKIKSEAEAQLIGESDRMFKNDVVHYFINKLKLTLPNDFLKRWLVKTSEQPITLEMLDKEYDVYAKSLQWQLIENKILENYQIKVTQDDVLLHAKKLIGMQMKQYGQAEGDDKQLTEIANNILKKEEERKKLYDQVFDERTLAIYKEKFKLNKKSISYDDFVKLASEKK
tara:strand:+ start:11704 stop:13059 length:1356 start_codon:yes stop_codon:yes gene_type:complete